MRNFTHLNIKVLTHLLLTFTLDYKLKQRFVTLPAIPQFSEDAQASRLGEQTEYFILYP